MGRPMLFRRWVVSRVSSVPSASARVRSGCVLVCQRISRQVLPNVSTQGNLCLGIDRASGNLWLDGPFRTNEISKLPALSKPLSLACELHPGWRFRLDLTQSAGDQPGRSIPKVIRVV